MTRSRHPRIDPVRLPLNDKWLDWAIDTAGGEEFFVAEIKRQIARRSSSSSRAQNRFLDEIGARGLWRASVIARTGRIRDRGQLLRLLMLLQPDIVIDPAPRPWNMWRGGSRVVVVVGRRIVSIKVVSTMVQQLAIGARDSEAFAEIARLFHDRLGLDYSIDLQHLPPKLP